MKILKIKNLLTQGFFADSAITMTGTLFSQIMGFILVPFLAHKYTPDDFGTSAIVLSIIGLFTIVSCGRYDLAMMLPKDDKDAFRMLLVSLTVSVIVSLLVGVCYGIYQWLSHASIVYIWMVFAGILLGGFDLGFSSWALRRRAFTLIAASRTVNGLMIGLVPLVLALFGSINPKNLILGGIIGSLCSALMQSSLLFKEDRSMYQGLEITSLWRLARLYGKFPLVEAWGALLNSGGMQLPIFMLASFFSNTVVGYYSMAYRLIAAPVTLVARAVSQVYFQRASELRRNGSGLYRFSYKLFLWLFVFGLIPFLPLTFLGQPVFTIFLGAQWGQAGLYAQYLSLGLLFQLAFVPLSFMFIILEEQFKALLAHIAIFAVPLTGLILGFFISPIVPDYSIMLLGGSRVILYILLSQWTLKLAKASEVYSMISLTSKSDNTI
jgi:O-antigen/teichoic acid export membrane protein